MTPSPCGLFAPPSPLPPPPPPHPPTPPPPTHTHPRVWPVVGQWGSLCFNALLSSPCRQQCSSSWSHSTRQQPTRRLRPAAAADTGAPAAEQEQQPDPPAVEQRTIKLRKPVGVVFAQNKGGPVFVEELTAGGNADKSGAVQVCLGGSLFLRTGPGRSRNTLHSAQSQRAKLHPFTKLDALPTIPS